MKFLLCWLEYFGKFPHHTSFPFPFHDLHYVAWGHATNSVWGGTIVIITTFFHYHHSIFIPFAIPKNFFSNDPLMHFTSCIDIHWYDSYPIEKRLSYTQWCSLMHIDSLWFPVKCVVIIIIITASKNKYNEMNVVNTRTNILIFMVVTQEPTIRKMWAVTHAFHIMKWVLLTQEPTFFIFMVFTQAPTIGKFQLLLMSCYILETFIRHHHSKPKFRCQRFFRRSMHGCMRTCNTLSWGEMLSLKNVPFSSTLSSLFLTFHHPITLLSYHFHTYMWVLHYYFPLYSF